MREITSKLTSKNQLTLPVEIRRHLGVGPKDKIAFVVQEDGTVQVRPATYSTVDSVVGIAGSLPEPMEWHEMRELARQERILTRYGYLLAEE
jgi:AbrB family looped-hinge helix DNA binding protein